MVTPTKSLRETAEVNQSTQEQPKPRATAEKVNNVRYLAFGLTICKEIQTCQSGVEKGASCYARLCAGNLVQVADKVFILTAAGLFSNSSENFLLLQGNKPIYQFSHAITGTDLEQSGMTTIPFDQNKKSYQKQDYHIHP